MMAVGSSSEPITAGVTPHGPRPAGTLLLQMAIARSAPGTFDEINLALTQPVLDLMAEYADALASAHAIALGLDALAASLSDDPIATPRARALEGRAKPQARTVARGQAAAPTEAPTDRPENQPARARTVEVTIAMDSLADIEAFEVALQAVPAVQRITVERLESGAAVLNLECRKGAPPPTVICTRCGIVLERGGRAISHGLCTDCAARVTASLA